MVKSVISDCGGLVFFCFMIQIVRGCNVFKHVNYFILMNLPPISYSIQGFLTPYLSRTNLKKENLLVYYIEDLW